MRKGLLIVGAVVGALVLIFAALFYYAATNLDSIVAQNREYILTRASDSLGRAVRIASIRAALGWGVMADLRSVEIGDDPAFSDRPFLQAADIYARVDVLPLLFKRIRVSEVVLKQPQVRIIRAKDGRFNFSSIGKKASSGQKASEPPSQVEPPPSAHTGGGAPVTGGAPLTQESGRKPKTPSALESLYVRSFTIDGGRVVYEQRGAQRGPVALNKVDLQVRNFTLGSAFDISLDLAAFADQRNVALSGTVGPIARGGVLSVSEMPLKLEAKLGPISLAQLRAVDLVAKSIPEKLAIPEPVNVVATANGSLENLNFSVNADLTPDHVTWSGAFDKPSGLTLKIVVHGSRAQSRIALEHVGLKLADLDANVRKVSFAAASFSARVDTNRFDIGALAEVVPPLSKYNASGQAELHSDLALADHKRMANGTLSLSAVSLSQPGRKTAFIRDLTGTVKLKGNAADAGPFEFGLGSGRARLAINADSIDPLDARYDFSADSVKLSDFVTNRPSGEHLNKLAAKGTIASGPEGISLATDAACAEGTVANVAYKDLNLKAALAGKRLQLKSLTLGAFKGQLQASGQATLDSVPTFALNLNAAGIDLEQMLKAQKAKAADIVRGSLDGQVQVSGSGSKFDEIKPTLRGNGRAAVNKGKLVNVNVAADALNKVKNLPEIGDLVPAALVERHPELFRNPDTDIQALKLTFTLAGPRLITHDLLVQTADYNLLGDGWFDMDKNTDMLAHILLSKAFSNEIIVQKKNVVYLTNADGQVDVPLRIQGTLPKPRVLPDIQQMAQRAAGHVIQRRAEKLLKKFLGR